MNQSILYIYTFIINCIVSHKPQSWKLNEAIFIPILQTGKLRYSNVKKLIQSSKAINLWN